MIPNDIAPTAESAENGRDARSTQSAEDNRRDVYPPSAAAGGDQGLFNSEVEGRGREPTSRGRFRRRQCYGGQVLRRKNAMAGKRT